MQVTTTQSPHSPFQEMGRNFKGEEAKLQAGDIVAIAAILGALIMGCWLLTRFLARQDRRRRFNSPATLFNHLCDLHELDVTERKLLKTCAKDHGLADPGRLFLEPEWFNHAAHGPEHDWNRDQLTSLRDKLFGVLIDEADQGLAGAAGSAAGVPSVPGAGVAEAGLPAS